MPKIKAMGLNKNSGFKYFLRASDKNSIKFFNNLIILLFEL
jgi:hypothetical protein